jgi:hypothetical protein
MNKNTTPAAGYIAVSAEIADAVARARVINTEMARLREQTDALHSEVFSLARSIETMVEAGPCPDGCTGQDERGLGHSWRVHLWINEREGDDFIIAMRDHEIVRGAWSYVQTELLRADGSRELTKPEQRRRVKVVTA